jgi:hypothetical protein
MGERGSANACGRACEFEGGICRQNFHINLTGEVECEEKAMKSEPNTARNTWADTFFKKSLGRSEAA